MSAARGGREQKRSFGYTFADLAMPGARANKQPDSSALSRQRPLDSRSHGCARAHVPALRVCTAYSSAASCIENVIRIEFFSISLS